MLNNLNHHQIDTISLNQYHHNTQGNLKQKSSRSGSIDAQDLTEYLQRRIDELQQELLDVRDEYEYKLADLDAKYASNNQTLLNIIQELKHSHAQQVDYYLEQLQGFENQKNHMTEIENKMNHIGNGIEDILTESSELSRLNDQLTQELELKNLEIDRLRSELQKNIENIAEYHQDIDEAEKLKLRTAKKCKDMLLLIEQAQTEIADLQAQCNQRIKKYNFREQICTVTGKQKSDCQHCRLRNLQQKYNRLTDQ